MNCGIEILAEEIRDTLYVPLQCVHLIKGETEAFVPRLGGYDERKVQVGKQSDKWVQVLSGLAEGEEVLLAPPPGLVVPEKNEEPKDGTPPGTNVDGKPGAKDGAKDGKSPRMDHAGEDGRADGQRHGDGGRRPEAQAGAQGTPKPAASSASPAVAENPHAPKDAANPSAAKDPAKAAKDTDAKAAKDPGAKTGAGSDAKAAPAATSTEKSSQGQ